MKALSLVNVLLVVLCGCHHDDPKSIGDVEPKAQAVKIVSKDTLSYMERRASDSAVLARAHPELYQDILRGDSLIIQGDTLVAVNLWRRMAQTYPSTFLSREALLRMSNDAMLDYMTRRYVDQYGLGE